ncbi:MAG: tetratricopeptide repeat protein [Roseomonas sp.]|nr:tetratricopeptide repeat protein [Roseomonas sp.]
MAADPHAAMLQAALALQQQGNFKEARRKYESIIARDPRNFNALQLCGVVALQQEAYRDAVKLIRRALALRGNDAPVLTNLGIAYQKLEQTDEALECFDKAIAAKPDFASAHHNRANLLREAKRPKEARESYHRAIALQPDNALIHANYASLLYDGHEYHAALQALDKALALRPDYHTAYFRKGEILLELSKPEDALTAFENALALRPNDPQPQKLLGQAWGALGRRKEADIALRRSITLMTATEKKADRIQAICTAVNTANLLPAIYDSEAEISERRRELLAELHRAHDLLAEDCPRSAAASAAFKAVAYGSHGFYIAYQQENDIEPNRLLSDCLTHMLAIPDRPAREGPRKPGPIRFGIASENLYRHNGSSWALPWLKHLPPDYQFFSYAFHGLHDDVSDGFAELGTHRRLSFDAGSLAKTIAAMRADDLDFLMLPDIGMTPSSRILSLHRIAPIQFTAWGHPVTSGSPAMDFYLSSDLMEPDDAASHYSEKLIRLPNLALYLEPGNTAPLTKDFPLPEGRVLYGCLQSLFKYLPRYDDILPRIAAEVPKALFVFIEGMSPHMTGITRTRLDAAFAKVGLSAAEHVVFLPRMNGAEFDALTRQMDVLVDSLGWSGGNTTLGATEAGVPLITCPGAFMRGRHSYAMFQMMGMPSAIARDTNEMVQKLIALGQESERRQAMREELGQRKEALYADKSLIVALDAFLKDQFAKL